MTAATGFAEAFAAHTHFKTNRFHPLVWINGEPEIGADVYIGGMSEVNAQGASVSIGDGCDIASFVSINCADSHRMTLGTADTVDRRAIVIEQHVFIGSHSVVKGGAHIGHHSVIAAGTVVDGRRIPPYSLASGNPMVVKEGYYRVACEAEAQVPHNRPSLGQEEADVAARVIRSGNVAQASEVRGFEDDVCAYLGLESGHAVAVSSGTAALYLALRVFGAAGKRVALPAYSCVALANATTMARAELVLVDTADTSVNVDVRALEATRPDIAVVAHMYGIPAELPSRPGVPVIEDCAHALGAAVDGTPVGLAGDAGIFSFYATKLITSAGQGGMFVSRSRALCDAVRDLREFDERPDGVQRFNFQLTDVQAAVGRVQLRRLPQFLERREEIFRLYQDEGLSLLTPVAADSRPVRYRAIMPSPHPAQVIAALAQAGATAIVPLHERELLGEPGAFPNARRLCRMSVSLPIFPTLRQNDVRRIAAAAATA